MNCRPATIDGQRRQCWVAEKDDQILGYACSTRLKNKAAYDSSVEVSVYAHVAHTGRGIAGTAPPLGGEQKCTHHRPAAHEQQQPESTPFEGSFRKWWRESAASPGPQNHHW